MAYWKNGFSNTINGTSWQDLIPAAGSGNSIVIQPNDLSLYNPNTGAGASARVFLRWTDGTNNIEFERQTLTSQATLRNAQRIVLEGANEKIQIKLDATETSPLVATWDYRDAPQWKTGFATLNATSATDIVPSPSASTSVVIHGGDFLVFNPNSSGSTFFIQWTDGTDTIVGDSVTLSGDDTFYLDSRVTLDATNEKIQMYMSSTETTALQILWWYLEEAQ